MDMMKSSVLRTAFVLALCCLSRPMLAEMEPKQKASEKDMARVEQGQEGVRAVDKEKRRYVFALSKMGYDKAQYEKDMVWYVRQLNYNGLREIHFLCYGDGAIGDYCYAIHFWNETCPSRNDCITFENGEYLTWPQGMAKGFALELIRRRINIYRYEVVKGIRKSDLEKSEDRRANVKPRKTRPKPKRQPLHEEYQPTAEEQAALDEIHRNAEARRRQPKEDNTPLAQVSDVREISAAVRKGMKKQQAIRRWGEERWAQYEKAKKDGSLERWEKEAENFGRSNRSLKSK